MSYDLLVREGNLALLTAARWEAELRSLGLFAQLDTRIALGRDASSGFAPARLTMHEGGPLETLIREESEVLGEGAEVTLDVIAGVKGRGPLDVGFDLGWDPSRSSLTLSFQLGGSSASILFSYMAAVCAARLTGGKLVDPQLESGVLDAKDLKGVLAAVLASDEFFFLGDEDEDLDGDEDVGAQR